MAFRYLNIGEMIKEGNMSLQRIPMESQLADLDLTFLDKQLHLCLIVLDYQL